MYRGPRCSPVNDKDEGYTLGRVDNTATLAGLRECCIVSQSINMILRNVFISSGVHRAKSNAQTLDQMTIRRKTNLT